MVEYLIRNFYVNRILELENALISVGEISKPAVQKICSGKSIPENLRANVWKILLGFESADFSVIWDDIYDLPEQAIIREDCQNLVDRLGNDEEDKVSVVSDLESVLTRYCKTTHQKYERNNKWLDVLGPLIALRLPKSQLYEFFLTIQNTYIPKNCCKNGYPFHFFRLLLLYHDPELCSFLDTKKITPDCYATVWFSSLFSATCDLKVIQTMWDIYLHIANPFLIFFLGLVIVINAKDQLLSMKEDSRQIIIDNLASAPCALESPDVEDFCSLAQYYLSCTPQSFCEEYHSLLFGNADEIKGATLSQALCMCVSVEELVIRSADKGSSVRFFVVDCRPAEQYNSGHLPTAFHLDASLMLHEPAAFAMSVEALFTVQQQSLAADSIASGDHLCFMGSGREEEDQYVHMVVASFLQKHQQFVSLAKGGYSDLHSLLVDNLDSGLTDHNSRSCIQCHNFSGNNMNGLDEEDDGSFLNKVRAVVRERGAVVKEKLVEYITNPQQPEERHVSNTDRLGKRYRGIAPVFSIDDDHEDGVHFGDSEDDNFEEVSIQTWVKKPGVTGSFKCDEIKENGALYPSCLIITDTHLFILREISQKKGFAHIVSRQPLSSIVKITSKRKQPELITFKYGYSSASADGEYTVTSLNRLLIPKAASAIPIIKDHILNTEQNTQR